MQTRERPAREAVTHLRGGIVLPLTSRSDRRILWPGSVLAASGRIVAVGPPDQVDAHPLAAGADVVDCAGRAVLPGLHNCHMHSGLLRGTAEGLPLLDWLATYVDPAHRAVTPEIAEVASRLCYAEALRSGTTSVLDMWRHLSGAARAAGDLGLRATLVPYVCSGPGRDYFETIASNRRLLEEVGPTGPVRAWVGLEHLLYCEPATYAEAVALADEFGTDLHTHSSEQREEVALVERTWGRRPLAELAARGLLEGGRCVVAHCVWLDDAELDLLAATGTRVAHCPTSNMKLASGPAPVPAMWAAGVTVGLGTDGEKENNTLDLLAETKVASLLQKLVGLDASAGDPWDILAMATVEGARCLGLEEETGSLAPGRAADVVTVDLRRLHTTPLLAGPVANVAPHLVFSASGADVDSVWVAGRRLVEGGALLTADEARLRADAQAAAEELFARRAALGPAAPGVRPGTV